MRIVEEKEWSELPTIWNQLINNNPNATTFQSYEFLDFTKKGKPQRKNLFRTLNLRPYNLVLYSDKLPVAIAPLLIKKHKNEITVYLRGHFTVANYLDFIYTDWSYEDFKFLMDSVRSLLGNVKFFLDRVAGSSITSQYLKKYLASANIEEHKCYAIPIPKSYDDWFDRLKGPVRQTLRRMNNRLNKGNVNCDARFYIGEKIGKATHKQMLMVYVDRFLVKNNFHLGPFKFIVKKILMMILLKDKMTKWLNYADNNFHAIVYMNHEIAAFTSGFISKDKRILLSRLAINTKYSKYSPGGILISSSINHLIKQNEIKKIDVDRLDLSRGGGNNGRTYKAVYGGELYYSYTFME